MGSIRSFQSIKNSGEFNRVYKRGRYAHTSSMVLYYQKGPSDFLGIVASKKVGKAVARNRAKRLLRALLNEHYEMLNQGSYVLVAKSAILELSYTNLQEELIGAIQRVGAKVKS